MMFQLLSINGLFNFRIVDLVDIVLFAILLYEVYNLVKGTAAIRIFIGINCGLSHMESCQSFSDAAIE